MKYNPVKCNAGFAVFTVTLLFMVSAVSLVPAAQVSLVPAAQGEQPNVIVIFTDDHGYADVACQDVADDVRTPHVDRLAAEGVRFTSGYVTAPQCVPSRAGLLSGQYQTRFGVDENGAGPLPRNVVTIGDRMQQAGYVTGMVGKWHLEPNHTCTDWIARELPDRTANRWMHIPAEKMAPYLPGQRGFSDFFHGHFSNYDANYRLDGRTIERDTVKTGLYRLDAQTEAALAFIRRHHDEPFFLYLAYFAPHVPLEATEKYLRRFPENMPVRRRHALAMLAAIDDGTGRILDLLATQKIDEQTLVVFISDNGAPLKISKEDLPIENHGGAWDGSLNDPWVGEKGMLTEGGIRVPFLMRWPDTLPAGEVYEEPVISLDVAATMLAMAGEPAVPELDGTNLLPFLTGRQKGSPHEFLYWRFWNQAAIRSGQWKYLTLGDGTEYLFDLASPEHEHANRLDDNPAVAARLREHLADWADHQLTAGLPDEAINSQEGPWYAHYLNWSPDLTE